MGNASTSLLTEDDVEELQSPDISQFESREILALYKRFQRLDKKRSGLLTSHDFELIPELSMNPLCHRIIGLFDLSGLDAVNFRDFVRTLWIFCDRCPVDKKLDAAFKTYDVDGDGVISESDLLHILKMLVGVNITDEQLLRIAKLTISTSDQGGKGYLSFEDFKTAIGEDVCKELLTMTIRF